MSTRPTQEGPLKRRRRQIWARSEPRLGEPAVISRARLRRPVKFSVRDENGYIVDAGFPVPHQAIRIEFPLLDAVRADPVAGIVMPFVLKANSNPNLVKRPQFPDETVVELLGRLPFENLDDGFAALEEFNLDLSDRALHAFDDDDAIIGALEPVLARRAKGRAVIPCLRLVKGGKLKDDDAFDRRSLEHFLAAIEGARRHRNS